MQRRALLWAGPLAAAWPALAARAAGDYEVTAWSALMAPQWDGQKLLAGLKLEGMSDGDPEAQQAMKTLRQLWDAAPANPALQGRRIRISGYLVPLEFGKDLIREFLLVPYFGACIHEPAPPANQVVHVVPARPITASERGTSAVTVSGTITLVRGQSDMAVTNYRMQADQVVPYNP